MTTSWRFPHQSLRVYQDACQFLRLLQQLSWPRGCGELKRQLSRAALSISLSICEGRGQRLVGNSGVNFYRIALGSAAECHGALEAFEILRGKTLTAELDLVRRLGGQLQGLIKAAQRLRRSRAS